MAKQVAIDLLVAAAGPERSRTPPESIAGTMLPVMGLIHFAMMFLLIAGLVTLVRNGTVFGWPLPPATSRYGSASSAS